MEKDDFLFEISWEVCNKVGGIHTVISSKVSTIKKYVENYFVMGPYLNGNKAEFTEEELPESFRDVYDKLVSMGINIYYGSWKVNGSPKVILVDYMGFASNVNDIKSKLWELYGIDSLNSAWHDFDEVILWSWCCGIVISELSSSLGIDSDVYVHAHEWMSGGSIFYINSLNDKKFKSVFTTHATMLGRTLGGCGESVYEIGDDFDPDKKAYEYGVNTKHQCERALSRVAGAFTTVSEITSRETKRFYGREPDRLLYNGFDNYEEDFEENIESIFDYSRKKINDFLDLYFKQFYEIDFKKSKVFYTSGRNEFRNKGVDLYIKALGMLNKKLKEENCDYDVVNLFLIPVGDFEKDERLNEDLPSDMKSDLWDVAPLSSHKVPTDNEIVSSFLQEGLFNKKDDKVKVVLVPIYLNENDGIFNENYYDVVKGMDLGIFASYYEPWGYTPLESISYGVATITSDMAGFGRVVASDYGGNKAGVKVLNRIDRGDEKSVEDLYYYLYRFCKKDKKSLLLEKSAAYIFSKNFSWEVFIKNYLKAYEIAKDRKDKIE